MKKLMVAAVTAAMIGSAFAACSDVADCVAWDLSMKLKSLCPKKTSCKDVCGDKSTIYYLDACTRTLKGYLWACEFDCEDASELNIVLWDSKNKVPVIPCPLAGDYNFTTVDAAFADMMVYGKKANKVCATFEVVNDAIEVTATGIGGSVGSNGTTCYVKSLSGYAAGNIALVVRNSSNKVIADNPVYQLCGDEVEEICEDEDEDIAVVYTTLCNVCCEWNGWCDGDSALEEVGDGDLVPAAGTWSMKFNKKIVKKDQHLASVVPSYAL